MVTEAGMANCTRLDHLLVHGDFIEARTHFERALDATPTRAATRIGFGSATDTGFAAMANLPRSHWALGEVERALDLINSQPHARTEIGHVASIVDALFYESYLEICARRPAAPRSAAEALDRLARRTRNSAVPQRGRTVFWVGRGAGSMTRQRSSPGSHGAGGFVDQGVRVNLGF